MADERQRMVMTVMLSPGLPVLIDGERTPEERDKPHLAELMLAAYQGTADDEGETLAQALIEMDKTFAGEYGPFMPQCSRLVERADQIVSAVLITLWQGQPFVAFAMTHPAWKRQGLARAGMVNAMQAVRARGGERLDLVVTLQNEPALRLYQSLGFVPGQQL